MIGRLTGFLDQRGTDHALIDVGGVGYVVHCSERTLAGLPAPGEPVSLWIEMIVREDLIQLIGFANPAEREWHRLLTSVQGVGTRVGLAILGRLGAEGVARALASGDQAAMRSAQGVGPKLAARIVVELKGKAPAVMAAGLAGPAPPVAAPVAEGAPAAPPPATRARRALPAAPAAPAAPAPAAEALSALGNLGYGPGEAAPAVAEAAAADPAAGTAELIRAALRRLAPRG